MALTKPEIDKVNNLYKENDALKAEIQTLKTQAERFDQLEAMLKKVLDHSTQAHSHD
jgi:cell shape-determining protein MreC